MPPRNLPTVVEIRGRQLIIWEDIDNKFIRACLAEFLAMHLFVLLCCGCAMVTLNLSNPNLMMVAASFGFGILTLAQIFGPLSGGHINSAVSLGLFVAGRTSLIKTLCYTLSQMLGSVFGALFLWMIFGSQWPAARAFGSNSWDESVFTGGQVFFAEMLSTMLLMFNVLATIDIPSEGGGPLAVFPIAMSVMVAHLFLIPIDGCSINPTRSFGPSLVAVWAKIPGTYYHQQAMFWFAPMFGAVVAAFFYEYGSLKPEEFAGAKDMDTAIFQAGKAKKGKKKGKHSSADDTPSKGGQAADLDEVDINVPEVSRQDARAVMFASSRSGGAAPAPVKGAYDGFEEEDLGDYT
jgi:MIP family channel proteins